RERARRPPSNRDVVVAEVVLGDTPDDAPILHFAQPNLGRDFRFGACPRLARPGRPRRLAADACDSYRPNPPPAHGSTLYQSMWPARPRATPATGSRKLFVPPPGRRRGLRDRPPPRVKSSRILTRVPRHRGCICWGGGVGPKETTSMSDHVPISASSVTSLA